MKRKWPFVYLFLFGVFSGLLLWKVFYKTEKIKRENAVILVLTRNVDLPEIKKTIKMFEQKFNWRFHYPYLFLNDEEFTEKFKKTIKNSTRSFVEFGLIPKEHWSIPEWIDREKMKRKFSEMKNSVMFGSKLSYHHMCRFYSGFFFRHELILKYDYYWRIEPDIKFHSNIIYDPFRFMREKNKDYGFTISITEFENTIPSLWQETMDFIAANPKHAPFKDKTLQMFVKEEKYTLCHFWSNFEIANLNMWRSDAYLSYFEHLDKTGGFFYERWGDAPVHSIAVAFLLPKKAIHYFKDIAYTHSPYTNCSFDPLHQIHSHCNPEHAVGMNSCLKDFLFHA